jgi:uroporphyrinogen decarboxylase
MPQFAPLKNDTFLRALLRQPTEYTPVWLMRQAGRTCLNTAPRAGRPGRSWGWPPIRTYATEVTLQPIDRYPLDAAILFSDILTVPDAMGLGLYFVEGEGPKFERPLRTEADVQALRLPEPGSLDYVFKAVTQIRTELNGRVPLIGFSGSPWTLACYMVEGQGSREFHTIKKMLYNRPDLMHHILDQRRAVAEYLNAQIDAGAQAVMIFDSWGGALADGAYQEFSLQYMQKVVSLLQREKDGVKIPAIVFTKGGGHWPKRSPVSAPTPWAWTGPCQPGQARELVGHKVALQGNLDPAILFASPDQIRAEVIRVLESYGPHNTGHVFNLGHGISQFTPPESVAVMVETVHAHSKAMRG